MTTLAKNMIGGDPVLPKGHLESTTTLKVPVDFPLRAMQPD
jgi:hypothetical protein